MAWWNLSRRPPLPDEWELLGTADPWGIPAGWAPGTSAPTTTEPAPCDVCGDHPNDEPCPFRQAAGTILDTAAAGWSVGCVICGGPHDQLDCRGREGLDREPGWEQGG